jgi:hypothetical protein
MTFRGIRSVRTFSVAVVAAAVLIVPPSASARIFTTGVGWYVNCFNGQLCDTLVPWTVETTGELQINFQSFAVTEAQSGCSDIRMHFWLDGHVAYTSAFLAPGDSTGFVNLGPVTPGVHTVLLQAEGREGGCNTGSFSSWSGLETFLLSAEDPPPPVIGPPSDLDACKDDGWSIFNNPTFKNQGACVSYVATRQHLG